MTEAERKKWRIENDVPEPESTHWLGPVFLAAVGFWASLGVAIATAARIF